MLQEDGPAGEDGSEDSGSDEDDSEEESDESSDDDDEDEEEEKEDEPLSLEWPDTPSRQATYLFLLPIIFPLWLTVPDVRNQVKTLILTFSVLRALTLCFTSLISRTEIQKVLRGHLPRLHSVDCHLLLPHGVVGTSGQSLELKVKLCCFSTFK